MKNTEYAITARRVKGNPDWVKGEIEAYTFEAMVFDESSDFGIEGGRVSKLWVWDDEERKATGNPFNDILAYERGWERKPATQHKALYRALLQFLEALPTE